MTPCSFKFADGSECGQVGDHLCVARAEHFRDFCAKVLVHTKGKYDGKPFVLDDWQYQDIALPLFGTAIWSVEHERYVRRYLIAWIEIARKNGKSELLAAIMLYLLCADGEAGGELYGIARDKRQAGLVYEVAKHMVRKSPVLRDKVKTPDAIKKMIHLRSSSFYEVISSDGDTALGSNPNGVAADEILAWRDRSMWDAMETGMGSGARVAPLLAAATTAGVTDGRFPEMMHKTMARIADNPSLSPHTFVYIRNTPIEADPWAEETWYIANPALGSFLSLEAMRRAAADARIDPEREQAFRQFRLNQWGKGTFSWMPMDRYDAANRGPVWSRPDEGIDLLADRRAFAGFDLSSKMDLTSICYLIPETEFGPAFIWRFYVPEEALDALDEHTDGAYTRFAQGGWLTVHDGAVIDFEAIIDDMRADGRRFKMAGLDADEWSSWPMISDAAAALSLSVDTEVAAYKSTYQHMSPAMTDVMGMIKNGQFTHFGNPLARQCFADCEARRSTIDPDLIRPDKPERSKEWRRIDAVPAALMARNAWRNRGSKPKRRSAYADRGVAVAGGAK